MVMGKVEREGNAIIWDKTGAELTGPSSYQQDKWNKLWACLVRHHWANQPLIMKSENRQVLSMPKAKLAWPFQEGGFWCRVLAGQETICRFEEMLWPHTLKLCCVPMWLILAHKGFYKFLNSASLQTWSHQSTVLHRKHFQSQKDLLPPKSTPPWGWHITHHSLSWAGEPHPHSKKTPAVPILLKDPCSFSRAHFHLVIEEVNNIADLMELAWSVRFISRQ